MLLGVLYCRSNRAQRAMKFYELVEIELTDTLPASDPEFRAYIPYLYEIPYKLMFRLYDRHRDQTPGPSGAGSELQPEVDILQYIPNDLEIDDQIKKKFTTRFVDNLFQAQTRLDRAKFEKRLTEQTFNLLQPHDIRNKAYEKFSELNA